MKATIRLLVLSGISFNIPVPSTGQVVAKATAYVQVSLQDNPSTRSLKDVLQEFKTHYKVDILYFNSMVEQYQIPAREVVLSGNFEKNLQNILRPLGLDYKKGKSGGYVIIEKKSARNKGKSQPELPLRKTSSLAEPPESQQQGLTTGLPTPGQKKAADHVVKGKVVDDKGEGIPGVNVVLKGTQQGTTSDVQGNFELDVSETGAILVFSFVGYLSQEIPVDGRTFIDIVLKVDARALDEVVVVGYGEQSKKKLSTAISKVAAKDINGLPVANAGDALAGLAAGVQVQSASGGTPGAAPVIRIRGVGSLGASNDPLYVVDGYPLPNATQFARINVSDIQSIEILKDAASASIYGSRAANGVVIVTTKRGREEKVSFNLNAYTGVQNVYKKMKVMNKDQYLKYAKDARKAQNLQYPDVFDTPAGLADTDWQDQIFRTAPMSEIQLSARGGSKTLQFSVSGSYVSQKGTMVGTDYQLGTLRANLDAQLSKSVKMGVDFAPSFTRQSQQPAPGMNGPSAYVPVYAALLMPPVVAPRLANGDYGQNNVLPFTQYGFAETGIHNPRAVLDLYENRTNSFNVLNNLYLKWELSKGLSFRTQAGISVGTTQVDEYIPSTLGYTGSPFANLSNPRLEGISSQISNGRNVDWVWENTLSYAKTFGTAHNFSAMLLYSMQKYRLSTTSTRGRTGTFTNDLIHNPTAATDQIGSQAFGLNSFMSYAARINYDYQDKYLFSASVRTDGSSRFGPDNRFGIFQSYSAGWRLSQEAFMANQNLFSELKLRASYGETGNANIGDFTWMSGVSSANYSLNNARVPGVYQNGYLNRNLTWEKNRQVDIGLEASFLKDRIYVSIDFYNKLTHGMLFAKELPAIVGYASTFQTNIGELRNRGVEVDINSRNTTGAVQWTTNFNISYNRSKVLGLGGRQSLNANPGTGGWPNVYRIEVGQPLGNMNGFIIDGIFKTQEELNANAKWPGSGIGDYKIRDVNGDGNIDENDRALLGNGLPDFIYGMTNTVAYKNFDLSLIVQGVSGNNIINGASRHTELWAGRFNAIADMADNYFDPANPERNVKYARVGNRSGFSTAGQLHSYAVFNGSFLRVRNLTLGYSLAPEAAKKVLLQSARIYLTAQNLFTLSKYPGFNPEPSQYGSSVYQPGSDQGTYPANRSFMLGINIGF
ncbi:TonB-dependent receptor [Dyadobacter sp. 676]|uniref:TonB-dependent receptor n=1 Tax=Dyadobacter sp. 676 TaxID=3088362 RepID=A0AAU8FIZ6_9BACT